jgi:hypothetical protein
MARASSKKEFSPFSVTIAPRVDFEQFFHFCPSLSDQRAGNQ